jgi:hypothetical protein
MKLRIVLAFGLSLPAAVGCFQTIDNGVVGGGPGPQDSTDREAGPAIGTLVDAGFPTAFAGYNPEQQCEAGSALCFQLCNSPECATSDGSPNSVILPPVLMTPAVILPDGGQSTDPCVQLEAESMRIRTNSCSQCHSTAAPTVSVWNWVLDDNQLVTTPGPGLTPPAPLVIAGNPNGSYLLQKIALGITGGSIQGMPPSPQSAKGLTTADAAATIVYPSPEDYSLMYAWILACAPGADAGASGYQTGYGGGNPDGGSYAPPLTIGGDAGH